MLVRSASLALSLAALGCAPALPTLSGGSTTPSDRSDLVVGAAARAPALDLGRTDVPGDDELLRLTGPGGVVPVGAFRLGLDALDVGVIVAGTDGRVEVRASGALSSALYWHVGAAVGAGYRRAEGLVNGEGDVLSGLEGYRVSGFVPAGLGLAIAGLFEAWGTLRLGFDRLEGWMADGRFGDAWVLRAGLALGLGVGFRRLHVLIELPVDVEHARGQLAGAGIERTGLVLTPAVALRVRF